MTDLAEINELDISGGCGNGTLRLGITHDTKPDENKPDTWSTSKGDRHLKNVCINDDDLEAISLAIFQFSTTKPYESEEHILKYRNYNREAFQKLASEFPMLGRINYIYEDAYFSPDEVNMLRRECVRLMSTTTNPAAHLGFNKLIYSCVEAAKVGFSLLMLSD